jgi:hypothetical protein
VDDAGSCAGPRRIIRIPGFDLMYGRGGLYGGRIIRSGPV